MITDRCLLEYLYVFVRNLVESGLMSEPEFAAYMDHYVRLSKQLSLPDVIVFLKCNLADNFERVAQRGRDYESDDKLDRDYLQSLDRQYRLFLETLERDFGEVRVVQVDTDKLNAEEVFQAVAGKLEALLGRKGQQGSN